MDTLPITAWLPTTAKEAEKRGWDELDIILITGDAYVDHPAFGSAVVGRIIESFGLRVAVIAQPNWQDDLRDFKEEKINSLALVNAGGTGHTYKNIDHLVLVQADSDKNGLTSQKIARTLLSQGKYKATIWIVCLLGTQDEKWIASTLENFDSSKIEYIEFKNLKL